MSVLRRPSTALGRGGMIATGHRLASAAGLRVLEDGGTAIDAALTAAGVLGVVQPMMSGLGADTFLLHRDARGAIVAINGSGAAPRGLTRERLAALGHANLPFRGLLSATVPGAVDAMCEALSRWGSGRFDLAAILAPAIRYADDGYPVYETAQRSWTAEYVALLARYPSSRAVLLDGGAAPAVGTTLRNPDYARTLRTLAQGGRDAFYRGPIARAVVAHARAHGGACELDDFAAYRCTVTTPIEIAYRGWRVLTNPLPSQGIVLLESLGLAERCALGAPESAETIHALVEAKKLAVADRNAFCGDPADVPTPAGALLAPRYLDARVAAIDPGRAADIASAGALFAGADHTTYLCAADADGNVVSLITSLSAEFGGGEIVAGTGMLLNNRGGRGFRTEPEHPNAFAPGRVPMSTLHPFLMLGPEGEVVAGGTPGGDGQPQWNLQTIVNLVDAGRNPQEAIDAPRWTSVPGTDPATLGLPFELRLEAAVAPDVRDALRAKGHRIVDAPAHRVGCAQLILRRADGLLVGGSETDADGCALAR